MRDPSSKFKTLDEIIPIVEQAKKQGQRIVTTNGCYDIIHVGHIRSLYEARSQGDMLIVGVNTDRSVKTNKGPARPINPENQRAELLTALECVDYAFLFDEPNPIPFLMRIQPHVHCNSQDYGYDCIESETVKQGGGSIYLLKKYARFSTTATIQQIQSLSENTQHTLGGIPS